VNPSGDFYKIWRMRKSPTSAPSCYISTLLCWKDSFSWYDQ